MIAKMLEKELWRRRRIDLTLRLLGRVDTMLTLIRERAGQQQTSLAKTREKLDEQKRTLDGQPETVQNAA